ncbi:MAG: ATP-binding cassette domain-containing protein [Candidatus Lokiarchaeota archaeon]|nr:ATP-binding cassette domain-containing protein [Candidatus Lokiarchaeota archaeon]
MDEDTILGSDEADTELDLDDLEGANYAIRLDNVSRIYDLDGHEIQAVQDVTMEVTPGEFVAISGPSGSGKTTLLNIIGCIDCVSSGRVYVMDVPIGDYDEAFRATFRLTYTGFIFQSYNLISTLTALENVMFPMQLSERKLSTIRSEASNLLKRVGLSEREDHLPWQMSSGEQQRVAIARAMANDPPVILADEPTANLDAESATMVRDLLTALNHEGKTVVTMTHDHRLLSLPDARRYEMKNGALRPHE